MALIDCPECNVLISDKAESCPNCGFPMQNNQLHRDFMSVDQSSNQPQIYTHDESSIDNGRQKYSLLIAIGIVIAVIITVVLIYAGNTGSKVGSEAPKTDSVAAPAPAAEDTLYSSNQSSAQDNSWLIGQWEVQTDYGLATLTILDAGSAISQGDRGTYTIQNGTLYFRDGTGVATTYPIDYTNHTLDCGHGYVMRKVDAISNNRSEYNSSQNYVDDNYTSNEILSNEQITQKAQLIQRSFTRYSGYAEDSENEFLVEINHAEMDKAESQDKLVLSGKMYQYVKYESKPTTTMGKAMSMATGNEQVVAAEKVTFYCSKNELANSWTILHCEGFFNYALIKVNIDWGAHVMHTLLTIRGKNYALKLRN